MSVYNYLRPTHGSAIHSLVCLCHVEYTGRGIDKQERMLERRHEKAARSKARKAARNHHVKMSFSNNNKKANAAAGGSTYTHTQH